MSERQNTTSCCCTAACTRSVCETVARLMEKYANKFFIPLLKAIMCALSVVLLAISSAPEGIGDSPADAISWGATVGLTVLGWDAGVGAARKARKKRAKTKAEAKKSKKKNDETEKDGRRPQQKHGPSDVDDGDEDLEAGSETEAV